LTTLPVRGAPRIGPQTATAAMLAKMDDTLSRATLLTGKVHKQNFEPGGRLVQEDTGSFRMTHDGSVDWTWVTIPSGSSDDDWTRFYADVIPPGVDVVMYDGLTKALRLAPRAGEEPGSISVEAGSSHVSVRQSDAVPVDSMGATLRALLAEDPDSVVTETTWQGHDAWKATLQSTEPGDDPMVHDITAIVDRRTGLVEHIDESWASEKEVWRTVTDYTDLSPEDEAAATADAATADGAPADGATAYETPSPEATRSLDATPSEDLDPTVHYVSLDEARTAAPFVVPVPAALPEGLALHDVFYRVGPRGTSPRWEGATWRCGLSSLRVMAYPVGDAPWQEKQDRIAIMVGTAFASRIDTLKDGLFAGAEATTCLTDNGPLLVVSGQGVLVELRGDLTRRELLDAAESLTAD
jgi:hypothetical protein